MCGLPLYHAYEKQMYKKARVHYIKHHPVSKMDGLLIIKLSTPEKLPNGYTWEEEGAEFWYQNMLYDIIQIQKINNQWEMTALADVQELSIDQKHAELAQQQKENSSKTQSLFKWVFTPYVFIGDVNESKIRSTSKLYFSFFHQNIAFVAANPPYMPPKMN